MYYSRFPQFIALFSIEKKLVNKKLETIIADLKKAEKEEEDDNSKLDNEKDPVKSTVHQKARNLLFRFVFNNQKAYIFTNTISFLNTKKRNTLTLCVQATGFGLLIKECIVNVCSMVINLLILYASLVFAKNVLNIDRNIMVTCVYFFRSHLAQSLKRMRMKNAPRNSQMSR